MVRGWDAGAEGAFVRAAGECLVVARPLGATPILAGLAVVILLSLVYPWGNAIFRRLLRALAWAGSLVGVAGVGGLIVMISYFAGDAGGAGLGGIHPATYLFVYACFLVLGVAFGVTAWLTRR